MHVLARRNLRDAWRVSRQLASCARQTHDAPALEPPGQAASRFAADRLAYTSAGERRHPHRFVGFAASSLSSRRLYTSPTDQPAAPGGAVSSSDTGEEPESARVYEGGLAVTVRRVKLLSLSSLAATVVGAPLLVHLSSPEAVTVGAKVMITGTLMFFGVFTTALLQWFASPYIIRLELDGQQVSATTFNVLARPHTKVFTIADMQEAKTMRPLATFQAHGKVYYIDGTADERLLAKLGLKKTPIKEPAQDEDEDD
jgi:hypothetical protein